MAVVSSDATEAHRQQLLGESFFFLPPASCAGCSLRAAVMEAASKCKLWWGDFNSSLTIVFPPISAALSDADAYLIIMRL